MSIEVSDSFKNAMKAPVKSIEVQLVFDGGVTYSGSDNLIKAQKESSGAYFTTSTSKFSFTLIGVSYNLVGQKFAVRIGADIGNGVYDWISIGKYKVTEQVVDLEKGTTAFKALDFVGIYGEKEYFEVGEFPQTVLELTQKIADDGDVSIEYSEDSPHLNHVIEEDLWQLINDVTFRDVLSEVAGATATMVGCLNGTDELVMKKVEPDGEPIETLTYGNLLKVKIEEKFGVINSVVLSRMPQEDNVALTDDESVEANGLTELKLANNEILDDNRESMISDILDAVDGFGYYPFEATTEGHGWHEVGDRIAITDGVNTWECIITSVKLVFNGSISEVIKGTALTKTQTNYALAGGIGKTIYNTEIKVDKQNQQINSVVSQLTTLESTTAENFSDVEQTISGVTTSIQETGGSNLILNSVGYDTESDGSLTDWDFEGLVSSTTSPESLNYGAISGNEIDIKGSAYIGQRVLVDGSGSQIYSYGCKIRKSATGTATIYISNNVDSYQIEIPPSTENIIWDSYSLEGFKASEGFFDIYVETTDNVSDFSITDQILNQGDRVIKWVQASSEILNTSVAVTKNGVKVKSSVYQGDYVEITPLEFAGYSRVSGTSQKVFSLNRDTTRVQKLRSEVQISMPPFKIVPIKSGSKKGWAFVKTEEE